MDSVSKLHDLQQKASIAIKKASSVEEINDVRIKYLGRKSQLVKILRSIQELPVSQRAAVGKLSNEIKIQIEQEIGARDNDIKNNELTELIASDWIDVTQPVENLEIGHKHPISQMIEFIEDIFQRMGFEVRYPYEIDSEFNNFTAVNIPDNHPARDVWDTFWTTDGQVAITHTSSMQNRILKSIEPPIRCIIPGRVFRNEATDARHEHTFHQVEGIYVDRGISMAHMLGVLKTFFAEFFGQEVNIQFTPDQFPFVEPGGAISIDCSNLGEGFEKISKGTGWLEVLGCGMVHPNVLEMGGINPDVYTGFAWGVGLERLIMLKYGIDDVRLFHSGDLRFVKQF